MSTRVRQLEGDGRRGGVAVKKEIDAVVPVSTANVRERRAPHSFRLFLSIIPIETIVLGLTLSIVSSRQTRQRRNEHFPNQF